MSRNGVSRDLGNVLEVSEERRLAMKFVRTNEEVEVRNGDAFVLPVIPKHLGEKNGNTVILRLRLVIGEEEEEEEDEAVPCSNTSNANDENERPDSPVLVVHHVGEHWNASRQQQAASRLPQFAHTDARKQQAACFYRQSVQTDASVAIPKGIVNGEQGDIAQSKPPPSSDETNVRCVQREALQWDF